MNFNQNQQYSSLNDTSFASKVTAWLSFAIAVGFMGCGIYLIQTDLLVKAFLSMGMFFVISATLNLAKTVRDAHENMKLLNKVSEIKTESMIKNFELGQK